MKQASQNIREIVAEVRASLPGFPANKQTELDAFALRIAAELDILDGAKRDAPEPKQSEDDNSHSELDIDPATDPAYVAADVAAKPAKPAKTPKAPAAE